jgi:transcriptional regulator GlxA family with amidase domain
MSLNKMDDRDTPPAVAFAVSENFQMIDFAGPWEVFQDVALDGKGDFQGDGTPVFRLFAVSDSTGPVRSTAGAELIPSYSFDNAPRPDIAVVGAQDGNSPEFMGWLRKLNADNVTLLSVCTGSAKLARCGLLHGKRAATHHNFVERFKREYPNTDWQTTRFIQSAERIYTAGGLTAGIDLALHVVSRYLGNTIAQATAEYLEHQGDGWKNLP